MSYTKRQFAYDLEEKRMQAEKIKNIDGTSHIPIADFLSMQRKTTATSLNGDSSAITSAMTLKKRHDTERRLGSGVFGTIASNGAASLAGSGCAYITADATEALSSKGCGSGNDQLCPLCWIVDNGGSAVSLTLTGCSSAYVSSSKTIATGGAAPYDKAAIELTFLNLGSGTLTVNYDGPTSAGTVAANKVGLGICLSADLNTALSETANKIYLS